MRNREKTTTAPRRETLTLLDTTNGTILFHEVPKPRGRSEIKAYRMTVRSRPKVEWELTEEEVDHLCSTNKERGGPVHMWLRFKLFRKANRI